MTRSQLLQRGISPQRLQTTPGSVPKANAADLSDAEVKKIASGLVAQVTQALGSGANGAEDAGAAEGGSRTRSPGVGPSAGGDRANSALEAEQAHINAKLDAILAHLNIEAPPRPRVQTLPASGKPHP